MLDASGSIDDEQRSLAGAEVTALEAWLAGRSREFVPRCIAFDAMAREVRRAHLLTTRASGGTRISAALVRCAEIIESDYDTLAWDVLAVLFTDGDNWSPANNVECIEILRDRLLPRVVAFGIAEFPETPYVLRAAQFARDTEQHLGMDRRVVIATLTDRGDFAAGSSSAWRHWRRPHQRRWPPERRSRRQRRRRPRRRSRRRRSG